MMFQFLKLLHLPEDRVNHLSNLLIYSFKIYLPLMFYKRRKNCTLLSILQDLENRYLW